jgi:hypothetical protein
MSLQTTGATPAAGNGTPAATPQTAAPASEPSKEPSQAARVAAIRDFLKAPAPAAQPTEPTTPETTEAEQGSPAAEAETGVPDETDLSQPDSALAEQNADKDTDETDSPEANDGNARKELPKWVKDRIAKTKGQRDAARQEAEALKARIAELEAKASQPETKAPETPPTPPPAEAGPLASITDPKALEQKRTEAKGTLQVAEDLLDQLMDEPHAVEAQLREAGVKLAPGDEPWTGRQMREYLRGIQRKAEQVLEAVPRRQQFLRDESAALDAVLKSSPELSSSDSPFRQTWMQVANDPGFRALRSTDANWPIHARRYALGVLAEQQQGGAAPTATPAKSAPVQPKVPKPIAAMPRAQVTTAEPGDVQEAQIRQRAASPNASEADRRALIRLELRKSGNRQ